MKVTPQYKSFGELFKEDNVFYTPKYQRDYSWESEQISQFCKDIEEAIYCKENGQSCEHFFGSIVCAQKEGVGKRKIKNLLVDGQQRLSTIVLFFSVIKEYLESLDYQGEDTNFKDSLLSDINKYFFYQERNHRETKIYDRIEIGNADKNFFLMTIKGANNPTPERDSHKLILEAKKEFKRFITVDLFSDKSIEKQFDIIDEIIKIFDESFLLIHIITTNIDDAYKLFMVLNDRGINLTEGELLKAHTLGNYDEGIALVQQMSNDWDSILGYDSKTVSNYLRWSIIMFTGEHITTSTVLQQFKEKYFTQDLDITEMANRVSFLRECTEKLNLLSNAEWTYDDSSSNDQSWYKSKLEWLIKKLQHTHIMPVLLAASFSKENEFKLLVSETCKFFIRYKVISGLHAAVFSSLYSKIAFHIYTNKENYTIDYLLKQYKNIIELKDSENIHFSNGIRALRYNRKGDNKPLKYLLITLEENWQWVNSGGIGSRKNRIKKEDRSRIFEFSQTTLEHLYPYNAKEGDRNNVLETMKNHIGNIALLDINRNAKNDNKSFSGKKENFKNTGIGIHKHLLTKKDWTKEEIDELTELYINYSCKVFSF